MTIDNGIEPDCVQAIRRLATGDIGDWHGLPSGCHHEQMAAVLQGGDADGQGLLSGYPVRFRFYQAESQAELLQAWFTSRGEVFLITFSAPRLAGDPALLLESLGEPEQKIEPGVGFHADAHQWVYATRGLTLFVREHLTEVARIAAYQPTTADYYERYLGGHDRRHYWPR
jgi:hypothetical protein